MRVKILRGVPGAGKSTYCKELQEKCEAEGTLLYVVSADKFFIQDGVYKFDATKLGEAHARCLRDFTEILTGFYDHANGDLTKNFSTLAVDNTNINALDVAPYAALATAYGAELEIVQIYVEWDKAAYRNVHGVPYAKVMEMHAQMMRTKLPPRWGTQTVIEGK